MQHGADLIRSLPAMITIKDKHNNMLLCSSLLASTVGRSLADLEGHATEDLFPDEADSYFVDDLEVMRTGRPKHNIIEPLELASGQKIWLRTDKAVLLDPNGSIAGISATMFDVSDTVRGELNQSQLAFELERAHEALRHRDEYLAMAVHELRGPLTAISLKVQALERRREGAMKQGPEAELRLWRTLKSLSGNVDSFARLMGELVGTSRLADGTLVLAREPLDLAVLVRELIERFEEHAARAYCQISLVESAPTIGCWDRYKIEQVIVNLLTNALKYGAGKSVQLGVRADEELATFWIRDHGIGIAPQDHARIFERFERAQAAMAFQGIGVGLFVARTIVEAHGGRVTVSSDVGCGAEFRVELPRFAT